VEYPGLDFTDMTASTPTTAAALAARGNPTVVYDEISMVIHKYYSSRHLESSFGHARQTKETLHSACFET